MIRCHLRTLNCQISASGGIVNTENVSDEKEKTSPIDDNDPGESEAVKNKWKKKSEPDTATGLRGSATPKRKPLWQETGDYCMAIQKQSVIVQSILTSGVTLVVFVFLFYFLSCFIAFH